MGKLTVISNGYVKLPEGSDGEWWMVNIDGFSWIRHFFAFMLSYGEWLVMVG
jgi:hypothetical protein